jgi:putative glycosyltransferase (TIGR04372 family)
MIKTFFLDVHIGRYKNSIKKIIKLFFIPLWLLYRIFLPKTKIVTIIRTDLYGHQVMEFQLLNHLTNTLNQQIYFNIHPVVDDIYLLNHQMLQLSHKAKKINYMFLIFRIFANEVDKSISEKLNLKRKYFFHSVGSLSIGTSIQSHYVMNNFPVFLETDKIFFKSFLRNNLFLDSTDKKIIAVHARSGKYLKYKPVDYAKDFFRNTPYSEIDEAILSSNKKIINKFLFMRVGHDDGLPMHSNYPIIDLRKNLYVDKSLQLSVFLSCDAYFGSSSGPVSFFTNQKKPCLLVSVHPLEPLYPEDPIEVMVIPKFVKDKKTNRIFGLHEQFSLNYLDIQRNYDDTQLLKNGLELISIPSSITSMIFHNWIQFIYSSVKSDWIKDSINATNKIRRLNRNISIPFLPIEYITYINKIAK